MPDDKLAAYFTIVDRDGVRFEPVFPPSHAVEPTTYFGGLPRLPAHIPWPEADTSVAGQRNALTFVGQVGLAELPTSLALDIPNTGTLFFFVDTSIEDLVFDRTSGGKVIYWNQSTSDVPFRSEPENLCPCFGQHWPYHFKWLTHLGPLGFAPPKSFPRFAMKAKALRAHDLQYTGPRFQNQSTDDPDDVRAQKQENNKLVMRAQAYAIDAVFSALHHRRQASLEASASPPVERNYFILPDSERRKALRAWRGQGGYPYSWLDVEIFFGALLTQLKELSSSRPSVKDRWRMDPDLMTFETEILAWLDRTKSAGRWTPVPLEVRVEFLGWYDHVITRASDATDATTDPRHWVILNKCLANAYRIGPRMCLAQSAEAAELVPDSWQANQSWQWATNLTGHGERFVNHLLLGPRREDPFTKPATHVPFMTIDTQDCFSWMWGDVGSLTFWIDVRDLAARDFSKSYVTLFSH